MVERGNNSLGFYLVTIKGTLFHTSALIKEQSGAYLTLLTEDISHLLQHVRCLTRVNTTAPSRTDNGQSSKISQTSHEHLQSQGYLSIFR